MTKKPLTLFTDDPSYTQIVIILCTKFGIYLQLTLTLTSERTITKLCLVTPYLAHSQLKRNSALIYGSS